MRRASAYVGRRCLSRRPGMKKPLRIGTRGSPLALIQAEEVRAALLAAHSELAPGDVVLVPIRTSGDWKPEDRERRFIELGGNKELFTREIEASLLTGQIDMAVHSLKDVSSRLHEDLAIAAVLERTDPRDVFIGRQGETLDALPPGATVGTSSLRRQAQILARRPDLRVTPLRGNVDTRLKKLADGMADATVLAAAGLKRLGFGGGVILDPAVMLPAAAQGALGVEIRSGDPVMQRLVVPLNSVPCMLCVRAERAMLGVLDGSCRTPIAALAQLTGDGTITLEGLAAEPDGTRLVRLAQTGSSADPESLGIALAQKIRSLMPATFFARA